MKLYIFIFLVLNETLCFDGYEEEYDEDYDNPPASLVRRLSYVRPNYISSGDEENYLNDEPVILSGNKFSNGVGLVGWKGI